MTKLWIPGKPVPKERPRATVRNGKTLIFTPKRTEAFERGVAVAWQEHTLGVRPHDGPFNAHLEFGVDGCWVTIEPLPSDRKYKLRGDLDNYVKSTIDGLQGVAFTNDINMVCLTATKW